MFDLSKYLKCYKHSFPKSMIHHNTSMHDEIMYSHIVEFETSKKTREKLQKYLEDRPFIEYLIVSNAKTTKAYLNLMWTPHEETLDEINEILLECFFNCA